MRRILGLDLGTTSIGWALVNESDSDSEKCGIVKLGVRVNPLTTDEQLNFDKGKPITGNAERTLKRSMRRNLQRYKLRRENLIELLTQSGIISTSDTLSEHGNKSTFKTLEYRATAATNKIPLLEFAKVLLMINKKRGYKSSRKAKGKDEGQLIDGMVVAKRLYEEKKTPGQFVFELFQEGKNYIPDFYRSDLQAEFDLIWNFQSAFYPELLDGNGRAFLIGKNKRATADYFTKTLGIETPELKGTAKEKRVARYDLRSRAVAAKLSIGEVAEALIEINGNIAGASGYLGDISDRSKQLIFHGITVGQYLWQQISENPHTRLKGQVFYRQDYLDEFEKIWSEQARHYGELTPELKSEIRDVVIFYQRRLKSQKGLVSLCEFESKEVTVKVEGKEKTKLIGSRVCPKSSPLFQEFKIWQNLNIVEVSNKVTGEKSLLEQEDKEKLFSELSVKGALSKGEVLKLLYTRTTDLDLNLEKVEGNRTINELYVAINRIFEASGHEPLEFGKLTAAQIKEAVGEMLVILNINPEILLFDSALDGIEFENQLSYKLWHLLYSYEDDNSATGNEKLKKHLVEKFGIPFEFAAILANVGFQSDYGSLSAKAIRKILPYLRGGNRYDEACRLAGYNHSNSLNREEQRDRILNEKLQILPKNSLRNPVVEKILNQMTNVVNAIIDEYGKPDEVRIELARELKKSAEERQKMTEGMNRANEEHERYRKILKAEFGLTFVSRNDIVRYKLYKELEYRGFKTLYTNTYIPAEKLFSKEYDIEHIIPQARLFDDSFSNKTLELSSANKEKGDETAYDYVRKKYGEAGLEQYVAAVHDFYKHHGGRNKAKRNKLLMSRGDIPNDFIARDLRDTQYIAKKAKSLLEEVFRTVSTTSGYVTGRLREDWQLVDVMQELNWNKYEALGLTYYETNKEGKKIPKIREWTKRNDHRHHAMDALTVAFTKRSYVQYLNNLNAKSDKGGEIYAIEQKELERDSRGKLRFKAPIPIDEFRFESKKHISAILVSHKAKNKVVTKNRNTTKVAGGRTSKVELTPRGQLHLETVYGSSKQYVTTEVKVGGTFDSSMVSKVAKKKYREALEKRLLEFGGDPKKAFTGKNSLEKNPIFLDAQQLYKVPEKVNVIQEVTIYTIRKDIGPDLKVDKVVDLKIRKILQNRLDEHNGNSKTAFSNLEEFPIWQNQEKGIKLKSVTITGISNAIPLHDRLNKNGDRVPVDFVNTGNNHHVAIYRDAKGNLQEKVVSLFEAVARINQGLPAVDKEYNSDEGWTFQFTMKQNEYFVFKNEVTGFDPKEIDLSDRDLNTLISPNLFRVQKLTSRDYFFRHHLETDVENRIESKDVTWRRLGIGGLQGLVKVRLNHLGEVIFVGEY